MAAEDLFVPVVKFTTGEERPILPHTWTKKIFAGRQTLSRTQIPLLHAWAITVHKCQGGASLLMGPSPLRVQHALFPEACSTSLRFAATARGLSAGAWRLGD